MGKARISRLGYEILKMYHYFAIGEYSADWHRGMPPKPINADLFASVPSAIQCVESLMRFYESDIQAVIDLYEDEGVNIENNPNLGFCGFCAAYWFEPEYDDSSCGSCIHSRYCLRSGEYDEFIFNGCFHNFSPSKIKGTRAGYSRDDEHAGPEVNRLSMRMKSPIKQQSQKNEGEFDYCSPENKTILYTWASGVESADALISRYSFHCDIH